MKIKRREFLTCSLVGVGDMLLGSKLAQAQEVKTSFFDPYELVPLGKTKIKVSRVGLGTGMRGWKRQSNQTRLGEEKFAKLIRSAYERGIRLFDLADLYGTHPHLIPALKKIPRKDYVIVSKIWWAPNGLPEEDRGQGLVPRQVSFDRLGGRGSCRAVGSTAAQRELRPPDQTREFHFDKRCYYGRPPRPRPCP